MVLKPFLLLSFVTQITNLCYGLFIVNQYHNEKFAMPLLKDFFLIFLQYYF